MIEPIPPNIVARQAGKPSRPGLQGDKPFLVAIAGGSGSGKTWLTNKLLQGLAPHAVRLSLDDFYIDRSHLSLARRARLNFDHPGAIDWRSVEAVLERLLAGRPARVPQYDFTTHSRVPTVKILKPGRIILLEGLWLLRRPAIRRLTSVSLFLNCPSGTRLRRRLARDLASRGRTRSSIRMQFQRTVEPMHARYVAPQAPRADFVFQESPGPREVRWVVGLLREMCAARTPPPRPRRRPRSENRGRG
jgi:uridine kinase